MMDMLGDSKSMRAIYISMALITILVLVGIAVLIFFNKETTELIAIAAAKLGLDGVGGVYRSVKVDAPIRHLNAQLEVEKAAKEADVPSPLLPGLTAPSRVAEDPFSQGGNS